MTQAGYDPHALGTFFKELLVEQRVNPTGVPPYMLSHPITEERVAHVDTIIKSRSLKTPAGRPARPPSSSRPRPWRPQSTDRRSW